MWKELGLLRDSINAVPPGVCPFAGYPGSVHVRLQMSADEPCSCGSDSSFTGEVAWV
jgi:hypothetical protein